MRKIIFFIVMFVYTSTYSQESNKMEIEQDSQDSLYTYKPQNHYEINDTLKKLINKILGIGLSEDDPNYLKSLSNQAIYCSALKRYEEAINFEKRVLEIIGRELGKENADYACSLNNLAKYNSDVGNYEVAINLCTEALKIRERVLGKENIDYAKSLDHLAIYEDYVGNYEVAKNLGTEAMETIERILDNKHQDYAKSLVHLATYNSHLGNYMEAIDLEKKALEILADTLGKSNETYATALSNLALSYRDIGNYDEAIHLQTEALEITTHSFLGTNEPNYATRLNNLAVCYSDIGNYDEAIRLHTEALRVRENDLSTEHPDYALSLNNLACCNSDLGNYAEAIRLETEALEINGKVLGKEHPNYALSLSNLACCNSHLGNYAEAIRLETEALEIREKVLGKEHPYYIISLNIMAHDCFYDNKYEEATSYSIQTSQALSRLINNTFSGLTTIERSLFWDKYKSWFEKDAPFYTFYIKKDSLIATTYDGALLSKGLLLNTEIEMNNLLLESGDDIAVSKYQALQSNRAILNKLYEKPIDERYISTDSLERVVQDQERELVQLSKTYGDYLRNLNVNWRQVRDKLGDNDVAIEFLNFGVQDDSIMYVALTLTKNDSCPKMIPLFELKQLEKIDKLDYYETKELSTLVWKPLEDIIKDKENIYFAPAGELHNIAIENIPCYDGNGYMSDVWSLYRLSSTRELALEKDKDEWHDAYVYGDLKYDTDVDVLIADSKKYGDINRGIVWEVKNIADSLNLRDGERQNLNPLPGTKAEVENVDKSLRSQNVNSTLLTGTIGTETSLKALSGQRPSVLHIATHGFYYPESEVKKNNILMPTIFMSSDTSPKYVEDKMLTRSGLYFAGALNSFGNEEIPEGVDDGILTAKEISLLDLRGLDLVVLSACKTGLGDIAGDGVFGLQRGFLKAGANTLVMSLREVNDSATEIFMSKFYSNLADGKTKYDAFRDAQQYLRNYEIREIHPNIKSEDWTAFILLDAIK